MSRIRPRLTYANVASSLALFVALSTGGAYAAATIGSADIVDESILSQDVKNGQVRGADLAPGSITSTKINDGSVVASEIGKGAVVGGPAGDVMDGSLSADDVGTGAVGADEVADFALGNEDVGVLFAVIRSNGTPARSSGGVTSSRPGQGVYIVDFGRDVTQCAYSATLGTHEPSSAGPGQVEVSPHLFQPEQLLVRTRTSAGAPTDLPYHLVVVC